MGLRMIRVTNQLLSHILVTSGMPTDLEIVGCLQSPLDQRTNSTVLIGRSVYWEDVSEGAAIPEIKTSEMPTPTDGGRTR